MKINPENIVINESVCLNYSSYFISGTDEGYIFALAELIAKFFSKKGFVKKILRDGEVASHDLFKTEDKYVYICQKYIGDSAVEEIEAEGDVFIFFEKNSTKNKIIKKFFSSSQQRVLLECFELDLVRKKNILNNFIKKNDLVFDSSVYWFLLELLDNRFAILITELEKISLLDNKNDTSKLISALNMNKSTDASKFFFKIHLKRSDVTSFINSSINSLSDFYSYFSYFKVYSLMLFNSESIADLENKIPKYLFREKPALIKMFDTITENKKAHLSSLFFKTENLVRKNPSFYKPLFFRFVLNYKKIIS